MSPARRTILSISLTLILAISGVIVAVLLNSFADAFLLGATLSGLNPQGGGPGFLLLIPPALAGLVVFAGCARVFDPRFEANVLLAFLAGGLVTVTAWSVARTLLPPDYPTIHVLMTSAGLACTVAWIVASTLRPMLAADEDDIEPSSAATRRSR